MKISIITSPFGCLPPNGFGAVEKVWYDLAIEMRELGHTVHFISKEDDLSKNGELEGITHIKGFKRTSSITLDLIFDFFYSWKALLKLRHSDIVILNTFWSPVLIRFFKNKVKKVTYNVQRVPKGQFWLYGKVDRFYCVSNAVIKSLIAERPSIQSKIAMIGNPINVGCFNYLQQRAKKEKFKILYYGRIHPEKGLEILVDAVSILALKKYKLELEIVGPSKVADGGGGAAFVKRLGSKAKDFDILWHKPISEVIKLRARLEDSDLFCYPSVAEKGETFGVAPLEAMACGRATVVSALECFTDFVKHNENGLVFDHRKESPAENLAHQLERLIKDDGMRESIAKEGAKTAENFSNRKISQAYLKDFEQILKNNKRLL